MDYSDDYFIGWLSGFFDGDGTAGRTQRKYRPGQSRFAAFTNTDKALIDFTAHCLDRFGVEYQRTEREPSGRGRKRVYFLWIRRADNFIRFAKLMKSQSSYKAQHLAEHLEWFQRPNAHRRLPNPTKEQLEELYLRQKLSITEIGRRLGYQVGTGCCNGVRRLLLRYDIPLRSRSESAYLRWSTN